MLANIDFHQLKKGQDESFDLFINQLKKEANCYSFQCNQDCAIKDIMIRDQIILGTTEDWPEQAMGTGEPDQEL